MRWKNCCGAIRRSRPTTDPSPSCQSQSNGHAKIRVDESGGALAKPEATDYIFAKLVCPDGTVISFKNNQLLNQLRHVSPKIQASFDKYCEADLEELIDFHNLLSLMLQAGSLAATAGSDSLRTSCGHLLKNAFNTHGAALTTLRCGFVLQPGILLRTMIEQVAFVLHLILHPEDVESYKEGNLTAKDKRIIISAKMILPTFGKIYGDFSNEFTHVGQLHHVHRPVGPYPNRNEGLEINFYLLRLSIWLLYVAAELTFFDAVEPRYWKAANGFEFKPTDAEQKRMEHFLRGP